MPGTHAGGPHKRRVWSLAIGRRASQQFWGVTAGKGSHNASNARGITAGKMGRNSSVYKDWKQQNMKNQTTTLDTTNLL